MLNTIRVILGFSSHSLWRRHSACCALLCCLAAVPGCAPAPTTRDAAVIDIGSDSQIFVDDVLIDRLDGAVRALGRPTKLRENPVIKPDRPWEGYLALQPGAAIYDSQEQIFKIWYNSLATTEKPDIEQYLCYATSRDGVTWEKPNLGLVEYKGSTANNIVLKWSNWTHSVIQDPHDSDPNRRYKMAYWQTEDRSKCGVWVAFSPDGVRWTDEPANPVVPCAATGDTFSVLQDPATKQFVLYHKSIIRPIRKVARLVSDDFVHWRDSRLVLEPDQYDNPDTEFYGMSAFPYGGQQLGLVWVFHTYTQFMDIQLASSRDGLKWERAMDRRLFMPLGFMVNGYPGRSFDSGMVWPANAPAIKDDEMWMFYSGFSNVHNALSEKHDGQIGASKMRLDGFVSLEATSEGAVVTQPIRFQGSTLTVNAATRSFARDGVEPNPIWKDLFTGAPDGLGWVRVEVQDEQGAAIPGYEAGNCELIRGDGVNLMVSWKDGKTLDAMAGRAVRLKFLLANASLYSFKVGE